MKYKLLKKLLSQKGTSFIEIMIALAIMGVITMSVFKTYIDQHKNYQTQDDITTIQQNVRASIDEISRSFRSSGEIARFSIRSGRA